MFRHCRTKCVFKTINEPFGRSYHPGVAISTMLVSAICFLQRAYPVEQYPPPRHTFCYTFFQTSGFPQHLTITKRYYKVGRKCQTQKIMTAWFGEEPLPVIEPLPMMYLAQAGPPEIQC